MRSKNVWLQNVVDAVVLCWKLHMMVKMISKRFVDSGTVNALSVPDVLKSLRGSLKILKKMANTNVPKLM